MVIFWGLKFDIFSIPNFLATFYVLGSPIENDLKDYKDDLYTFKDDLEDNLYPWKMTSIDENCADKTQWPIVTGKEETEQQEFSVPVSLGT